MMKMLRNKELKKKVIWAVAIVIIISFGFFGTAYLLSGITGSNDAGKVFGKKITISDFQRMYDHARVHTLILFGDNYNRFRESINLEADTWDRIILLHEAKRKKIKVEDQAVINQIEQYDFFKLDGRFDNLAYNNILRNYLNIEPRDFEESVRENLIIAELYKMEAPAVELSEQEILNAYIKENERVQVKYILVSPKQFAEDIKVSNEDAMQYYNENKLDFLVGESIDIEFIKVPTPKDATDEIKSGKSDLADNIYEALYDNPNMQEIANQNQLTVETTGLISKDNQMVDTKLPLSLLNEIFNLDDDEVNTPFETTDGFVIARIKERKEPYVPEFNEAKPKIVKAVQAIKAKEIARENTSAYLKQIHSRLANEAQVDFATAASALGLAVETTPKFNRGQYIPKIGISKDFENAAFNLTKLKSLSDVVEVSNGFCILKFDEYFPIEDEIYEAERENFSQRLYTEQWNKSISDYKTSLRLKANLIDNLAVLRQRARAQSEGAETN